MSTATEQEATEEVTATLADLVRDHQANLWRYLRFLGCAAADADDLVQETFLAVARRPFEVRSPGETASYLRTAARRQMLMSLRRKGKEPAAATLEQAEAVWAEATTESGLTNYLDALEDCLQTAVDTRARTALDMQFKDRSSRAEIAQALDLATEGVKTLLRRARESLKDCIERKLSQDS